MKKYRGNKIYLQDRQTIVVVSHEASATGAPILALNICKELSERSNVALILLKGGELVESFEVYTVGILVADKSPVFGKQLEIELKRMCQGTLPNYAIINSVVSASTIQPIRSLGIPVITLIHEFSSYIRPSRVINDVALWSNRLIFSSELTKEDIVNNNPQIKSIKAEVIPQGRCEVPIKRRNISHNLELDEDASNYLDELDKNDILIVGAGEFQPRKGIDLFVAVASQIKQKKYSANIKFAWMGGGYNPIDDFNVSIWIKDQIMRSGLSKDLKILNKSKDYTRLINRADIFLMTSRLDPLPNVAIDAMCASKPMFCFDKACGIANLLKNDKKLGDSLVVEYLNTVEMAEKVIDIIRDKEKMNSIAQTVYEQAKNWFNMERYIDQLESIADEIIEEEVDIQKKIDYIFASNTVDEEFCYGTKAANNRRYIEHYLRSWKTGVGPRKPFPGFHPGIYQELVIRDDQCRDPLFKYLIEGKPLGKWSSQLIRPRTLSKQDMERISNKKIALHIHAYYPELLREIINATKFNSIKPDLFISCRSNMDANKINQIVQKEQLRIMEITIAKNRGRDIGPLLSGIGKTMDENYDIYGHIHTKKSIHISKEQSENWRKFLIKNLVGDKGAAMIDIIVDTFTSHEDLGIVFPDDPHCPGWDQNYEIARIFASKMGIHSLPKQFNFPIGTMFWAQKGALKPLYDLKMKWTDYPVEPIANDGTILHAIERLIPIIAESEGYRYALTNIPGVNR